VPVALEAEAIASIAIQADKINPLYASSRSQIYMLQTAPARRRHTWLFKMLAFPTLVIDEVIVIELLVEPGDTIRLTSPC
jgi:hypothetical protein